nr:hypothetical protein [Tanacetum cinerariifolium]
MGGSRSCSRFGTGLVVMLEDLFSMKMFEEWFAMVVRGRFTEEIGVDTKVRMAWTIRKKSYSGLHDTGVSPMVWDHDMVGPSMVRDDQVENQIVVLPEALNHP